MPFLQQRNASVCVSLLWMLWWQELILWWKLFILVLRMQPERKRLGGPQRFEIETPHSHLSLFFFSLFFFPLLHPFFPLPTTLTHPWLRLWTQQPCNTPLSCSKGLSYSRRTRHAAVHLEKKKHCFIHLCVTKHKTAQTVNGGWRHATPCGYRSSLPLVSQKISPFKICTDVPKIPTPHGLVFQLNTSLKTPLPLHSCVFLYNNR